MGDHVDVAPVDDATLKEAMCDTPEEITKYPSAISEKLNLLNAIETLVLCSGSESIRLSAHVILKVKQNADG